MADQEEIWFVTVMISADPEFKRDGYNIMSDVVISYPTAVLWR